MNRCKDHGREVFTLVEPTDIYIRLARWFHLDDDTECDGLIETVPS